MEKTIRQTESNITRIVFYGPESTGKSTLARKMAEYFNTDWVPEYARDLLQVKMENTGKTCESSDMLPIVQGQIRTENELIKTSNQYLFCDTDPLETYVYTKIYFPDEDFRWLDKLCDEFIYDYYFLTYIDTPWVPDDLRDKPNEREEIFKLFYKELKIRKKNFTILKGNLQIRTEKVLETLKNYNYETNR